MDTSKLTQINKTNADNQLAIQRHTQILDSSVQVSNTVLSAVASLIKYLEGHVQKSEVINQLESIATPDALEVIPHIEALHATLKTHKNTDLTELTGLIKELVGEAKLIPKEKVELKEREDKDYSDQFKALKEAVDAVGQFIKDQKTIVEAPVVNVDAPIVNVPPTDLKPLQKDIKSVVDAVKKIVIPEYTTDNAQVEALITKSNKLLKELVDKPISRGGGGGGVVSYVNSAGLATPVTLTATGKVPVEAAFADTTYKQIEAADDNVTTVNYTDVTKTDVATIVQTSATVGATATETFDNTGGTTLVITRGVI